jgi:hypothetical protein
VLDRQSRDVDVVDDFDLGLVRSAQADDVYRVTVLHGSARLSLGAHFAHWIVGVDDHANV